MAATAQAFGLRPAKNAANNYNSQGMESYPIASGYNTSIFQGDVVSITPGGTIVKATATNAITAIGVFMGVSYSQGSGLKYFVTPNNWAAGTVAADAYAMVVSDPDMLFEIAASSTLSQNAVMMNASLVQGSGNTTNGISGVTLDAASIASTNTLPMRIVNFKDRSEVGSAYPLVLVKFNVTHQLVATTGNTAG